MVSKQVKFQTNFTSTQMTFLKVVRKEYLCFKKPTDIRKHVLVTLYSWSGNFFGQLKWLTYIR